MLSICQVLVGNPKAIAISRLGRHVIVCHFAFYTLFVLYCSDAAELRIAGSWSAYASQSETAAVFMKRTGVGVSVAGANNSKGVDYLLSGRIDVLMWTPAQGVSIDDMVNVISTNRDWQPVVVSPGRFAALVLVHEGNPTRRLTYAQLRAVFSGKVTNWSELGGKRGDIRVVAEADSSKGHEIFVSQVMASASFGSEIGQGRDFKDVSSIVAKDRNAIGFCLDTRQRLDGVRAIGLSQDGKQPFTEPSDVTILSRRYPLVEDVYLIASERGGDHVLKYCRFACGPEASDVARKWNLYSTHEWEALLQKNRLSEFRAGRGVPLTVGAPASVSPLLSDLGATFAEDQAVVQVVISPPKLGEEARNKFLGGSPEILVVDGPSVSNWTQPVQSVELGQRHLGVIVNPESDLKSLSIGELREICSGSVKKWSRGAKQGTVIKGYGPASDAPCMRMFHDLVVLPSVTVGGSNSRPTPIRLTRRKSTGEVVTSVASDTAGIGFVDLNEMNRPEPSVVLLEVLADSRTNVSPAANGGSNVEGVAVQLGSPSLDQDDAAASPTRFSLSQPVTLYLSPKASPSSERFFEWLERELPGDSTPARNTLIPDALPPKPRIADVLAKHGIACPSR
jgi:phosphate transport system substrate-binding protein